LPNITESKWVATKVTVVSLLWYNYAFSHVSDDLRRTPETAPSNPGWSI